MITPVSRYNNTGVLASSSTALLPFLFTGVARCAIFGMSDRALFPMVVFAEFIDVATACDMDNRFVGEGVVIDAQSAIGSEA